MPVSLHGHSASITVLGLLKNKEEEEEKEEKKAGISTKRHFAVFKLAIPKTLMVVINGLDRSGHTPVCCLATYHPVRICAAGLCVWSHWFVYVCIYMWTKKTARLFGVSSPENLPLVYNLLLARRV